MDCRLIIMTVTAIREALVLTLVAKTGVDLIEDAFIEVRDGPLTGRPGLLLETAQAGKKGELVGMARKPRDS